MGNDPTLNIELKLCFVFTYLIRLLFILNLRSHDSHYVIDAARDLILRGGSPVDFRYFKKLKTATQLRIAVFLVLILK